MAACQDNTLGFRSLGFRRGRIAGTCFGGKGALAPIEPGLAQIAGAFRDLLRWPPPQTPFHSRKGNPQFRRLAQPGNRFPFKPPPMVESAALGFPLGSRKQGMEMTDRPGPSKLASGAGGAKSCCLCLVNLITELSFSLCTGVAARAAWNLA